MNALNAGNTNVIELRLTQGSDVSVDAITVSTSDDLIAAEPHRKVVALSESDREALYTYIRSMDGRAVVTRTLATDSGYATIDDRITMEAENALVTADTQWVIQPTTGASGGNVSMIQDGLNQSGSQPISAEPRQIMGYPFHADAGSYSFYAHLLPKPRIKLIFLATRWWCVAGL